MSFSQAGKQRKMQNQAEADADKAMQEARKRLEVNYYDQLSIFKDPYELQREAAISSGAQAIQAGVESERGAAATAGRVQMAQNEAQAGIRTEMGQELSALEKLSATEDARLRDINVQLDLGEVAGAQQKAADAQAAAEAATMQGVQSVGSAIQQGISIVPLYQQSRASKAMAGVEANYNNAIKSGNLGSQFYDKNNNPMPFQQAYEMMAKQQNVSGVQGIGQYNSDQWMNWMGQQDLGSIKKAQDWSWLKPSGKSYGGVPSFQYSPSNPNPSNPIDFEYSGRRSNSV